MYLYTAYIGAPKVNDLSNSNTDNPPKQNIDEAPKHNDKVIPNSKPFSKIKDTEEKKPGRANVVQKNDEYYNFCRNCFKEKPKK